MAEPTTLMTNGRFSSLSRLSVRMLRHSDAQGVLIPADIDPSSGYRRSAPPPDAPHRHPDRFASIVRVGPKGQIVIPKEAREMFGIEPGTSLLLLADEARGIAIVRQEPFREFIDTVMPRIDTDGATGPAADDPPAPDADAPRA